MRSHTLYGRDLDIGETFLSDGMTVTESHIFSFAGLSGDFNPLHVDRQWAETEGPFGERIAHGMLCLSIASGLRCKLDDLALVGFLGLQEWRFQRPVRIGDTIRCRMTLADLKPTSKAGRSILTVDVELLNQHEEAVQRGAWKMMILDDAEAS